LIDRGLSMIGPAFPHASTVPGLIITGLVVSTDPGLSEALHQHGIHATLVDPDAWADRGDLPMKERRLADRQTLLLGATAERFLATIDFARDRGAVQVAVGPARTDFEALQRWARRLEPGEALPMVQPAAAVGLLPNTPLAWISRRFHLTGEGSVWAGFSGAGAIALRAAIDAIGAGCPEALVLSISCPDPTFVPETYRKLQEPFPGGMSELGVALHVRPIMGGSTFQAHPPLTEQREVASGIPGEAAPLPRALLLSWHPRAPNAAAPASLMMAPGPISPPLPSLLQERSFQVATPSLALLMTCMTTPASVGPEMHGGAQSITLRVPTEDGTTWEGLLQVEWP
jgi:hypothetical protein